MLPTAERLKTSQNIERVLRRGRRINSSFFTIYRNVGAYCNTPVHFRGAVVAGLKVSKKATERNRVKRQIQALLREYRQSQELIGDFVFILRKEIINANYQQINLELTRCLNGLRLAPSKFIKKPYRQTTE